MAERPEPAYARKVSRAAGLIGLGAMVAGALVLWGWASDIEALKSFLPGSATMKANAAVGFVLAGASLWLSKPRPGLATNRWATGLSRLLAAVVGALGIMTLAEYGLGRDFGIDQWLFATPGPAPAAGRMSVMTALNFVLLAVALLLLDAETGGGKRPTNWIACVIAVNSFLVILGYLYGVESPSQILARNPVALHTALLLLFLTIGLACIRPNSKLIRQIVASGPEGLLSRRLLPAAILLPPFVGWLRWKGELAGFYDTAFGLALFAASNVLIFASLAWWAARALGKSHDSLLASGQRMENLLESISDAFLSLDSQWRFVYINEKAALTFGRPREQLIGRNIWREFPQLVGQPFYHAYHRAMAERRYVFVEDGYAANDTWFENRIYPTDDGISVFVTVITERKRAEIALNKNEQRLLEAQRLGRIGDWEFDVATGQVSWSPQVYQLYERDPALAAPSFEEFKAACDAENRSIIEGNIKCLLETGAAQTYALHMVLPSGAQVHHSVIAVPILDETGQVARVRGIVQDITERKRAESALRQSEQQLRSVLDGLGPHMFVGLMDTHGVLLMANRPARAVVSLSDDEVIGRPFELTYWWSYSDDVVSRLKAAVQRAVQGEAVRYDEQIRVAEGQLIWIDFSIHPLRDEAGTVVSLIPSAIVITERKQAEAALRSSTSILELFVKHSPASLAMFDRDMNYIVVSDQFLHDYDLVGKNVVGRCHYDMIPEITDAWKEMHRRCLAGASEKADAEPFERANGRVDWVRWEVLPWRDSAGDIGGIVLMSEVVTERVRAREQLRAAASRQQALARRLVEVQEDEHRRLSAELHDRIGQNLTALSINLNIIGSSNAQGDATAARLGDSRKLLEQTIASVRDLITELRPAALDDYGLLAGLRWFGAQVHERTGLKVAVLGEELSPRLDPAAESALFRISQEALTNIVKHAQAKNATLTVHRRNARVILDIADDGCGFNSQAQAQSGPRGHWGLEMMRERAEAVGAQLHVESSPGHGTLVVIEMEAPP